MAWKYGACTGDVAAVNSLVAMQRPCSCRTRLRQLRRHRTGWDMARRGSAFLALVAGATALASASAASAVAAAEVGADLHAGWGDWVRAGYERAPALVLGLAAMIALLPLAFAGRLVRGGHEPADADQAEAVEPGQPAPEATRVLKGAARVREVQTLREQDAARPAEAWIDVAGAAGRRYALGRSPMRIGREDDNDIQLPLATVHRYHAVLHRTPEAEYVITDLSSASGNGLLVNGRRLAEARLRDGDTVQLGEATLTFAARPA
jgi:hypothetical protein